MKRSLITAVALAAFFSSYAALSVDPPKPRYGSWGVDYADMDRTVKPGDDFFNYVEGTWLKTHPIPADKSASGYNNELPDEIELQVRELVEQAAKNPSNPTARQIGDFYAAWMDQAGIETRGLAPLEPFLARIDAVKTRPQLVALMTSPGYASPIDIDIAPDFKDPTRYAVIASQADLGLPSRDYYLLSGADYDAYRKAYQDYIVQIETLAGVGDATAKAKAFIALETRLSKDQWKPERMRDPQATYNPMSRAKLRALAPAVLWDEALAGMGLGDVPIVVVAEPSAVAGAARRIADVPLQTWRNYLKFRFISAHAQFLPKAFDEANFNFYSHTLRGVPQQRERWKRGIRLLDRNLGEAVGELYVAHHWSAETESQVNELMSDMRAAYAEKISNAGWMDEPTRQEALKKLHAFDPRFGHPVRYIDYSKFKVNRSDPLANAMSSVAFQWQLELSRFTKPVDRSLWFMTPQTVDAYYDPSLNQITVPAAILQPPFFDPNADPAVNYAETGATTIGHEVGHGYDDEGRQFDPQGRLRDWWTPDTAKRYNIKAEMLAAQFDTYEPLPGVHIKGHLTLGENLADLGGMETGYAAYRRYVARHGEPPVIDGFTGDQRFFLAYAAAWQGQSRDGALREQLLGNEHSPEKYRVNGIVRNFDPWYAAFAVQPTDKLYLPKEQRVHIW